MNSPGPLYIIAAGTLAAAAYVWWTNSNSVTYTGTDTTGIDTSGGTNIFSSVVDSVTSNVQNAFTDPATALANPNVQAWLATVRTTETGTSGPRSYTTIAGGGQLTSLASYPTIGTTMVINGQRLTTHAVGGYQFEPETWSEAAAALGLTDFSPASQDLAAVWLTQRRGALADVINGNLVSAIQKCNKEWASLPGSPYNQNPVSQATFENYYASNGGIQTDAGTLV
jgi:lysozyme